MGLSRENPRIRNANPSGGWTVRESGPVSPAGSAPSRTGTRRQPAQNPPQRSGISEQSIPDQLDAFIAASQGVQQALKHEKTKVAELERMLREAGAVRQKGEDKIRNELRQSQKRTQELEKSLKGIEASLRERDSQIDKLNTQNRIYMEELRKSQQELTQYQRAWQAFQGREEQAHKLTRENRELKNRVQELEQQSKSAEQFLEVERRQRKSYEQQARIYQNHLQKAVEQLRAQAKSMERIEARQNELDTKGASQRAALKEALKAHRSELDAKVETSLARLEKARVQMEESLHKTMRSDVHNHLEALTEQLAALHKTVHSLKNDNKSLKYKIMVTENMKEELNGLTEQRMKEANELTREFVRAQVEKNTEEMERALTERTNELDAKVATLLSRTEKEIALLRNENKKLEDESREHALHSRKLESEVLGLQDSLRRERNRSDERESFYATELGRVKRNYPMKDLLSLKETEIAQLHRKLGEKKLPKAERKRLEVILEGVTEQRDQIRSALKDSGEELTDEFQDSSGIDSV